MTCVTFPLTFITQHGLGTWWKSFQAENNEKFSERMNNHYFVFDKLFFFFFLKCIFSLELFLLFKYILMKKVKAKCTRAQYSMNNRGKLLLLGWLTPLILIGHFLNAAFRFSSEKKPYVLSKWQIKTHNTYVLAGLLIFLKFNVLRVCKFF